MASQTGQPFDQNLNPTKTENDGFAEAGEYFYQEQVVEVDNFGNLIEVEIPVEVEVSEDAFGAALVEEIDTTVEETIEITVEVPVDITVEETSVVTGTKTSATP
jgi:hypothetical protein